MASDDALPQRAQVVVVGGGAIGTSVAYHLTTLGVRDVVLVERKELTSGTTWHAAGLITSAGMPTETFLWMSRYTTELLPRLTEETGQDTGFRTIGHLHLASTPQRLETITREALFAKAHGVPVEMVGPEEVARHWPAAKTDDILAAAWVPDEGRANPADVAQAYAKAARAAGARIVEGVSVTGFTTEAGRVTAVLTDRGAIETEIVVISAGMWGRQLGALAGVSLPLQAAEHYYLLTDDVEWAHPDLPVVEDPDRYGYYREEGGGILVGLFEPKAAPWSLDRIPHDLGYAVLEPDWDRVGDFLSGAMDRFPSLHQAGIRQFFCGPESFTADNGPLLGEAPELRGFFAACGLNSLGILLSGGVGSLVAQWIVDGEPPMDVTGMAIDRMQPFMATRAFRQEKTVELLGTLFGDAAFPSFTPRLGRNVRRSVLHDRLADAGAEFLPLSGYEVPDWFAAPGVERERPQGWKRDQSFEAQALEHTAVREAVGVFDMSFMAKVLVTGADAEALLNRVSVSDVSVPVGKIVYTQWLTERAGIWTDVTVTRLADDTYLVVGADVIHRRILAWLERHRAEGEHVALVDVTSGRTLLSVQGPRSRELLQRLTPDDLSNDAFPYLRARPIEIASAPVLALRVTYVGELGWELHVETDLALTVFDALVEAGAGLGLRNAGLGALNSLRMEKAYRDYGLDIDNGDTPIDVGLDFTVAWDKPGGFVGRDALVKQRDEGVRRARMVQLLASDPEPLLYGDEQLYRDGEHVGENRFGGYGHTLGGAVGLAMVEREDDVTDEFLLSGAWELDIVGQRCPVTLSLEPMYDPKRERIKR
ncbi:MAG TPA: FAD-dependent oxidoreductase [Actinomycetota bacterium]|nr:FAD-dependent oxidoreductase [Actinomycetota bacterium]